MATQKRTRKRKKTTKQSSFIKKVKRIGGIVVSVVFFIFLLYKLAPVLFSLFPSYTHDGDFDGIDVSKHQGKINWEEVATHKNIKFVYIKATEGRTMVDKTYKRNIREARKAGFKVGSYHFFKSNRNARDQFENFRQHVNKKEQDLIPMVDVEESGCRGASRAQLQASLDEFMKLMKEEYGAYPLLYSQYRFYNEKLAPEFNRYFIFIARYSDKEPVLRGSGKHNIWQYSERGKVSGINEYVDLDKFVNGTTINDIRY